MQRRLAFVVLVLTALVLAGCNKEASSHTPTPSPSPQANLLRIDIDLSAKDARAHWQSLSGQVLSDAGQGVSFGNNDQALAVTNVVHGGKRYIAATFEVVNGTGNDLQNLYFVARDPNNDPAQNPFNRAQNFAGSDIAVPPSMELAEAYSYEPSSSSMVVQNSNYVSGLDIAGSSLSQPQGLFSEGFLARDNQFNRSAIPAGARGKVTFSVMLDDLQGSASDPFSFSIYFYTATDANLIAKQCGGSTGFTCISSVQGASDVSPLEGQSVRVQGIVVADFQGDDELRGFFVQEEDSDSDGDPSTSEALFVYATTPDVHVGDKVTVEGTVVEYNQLTEIGNGATISIDGSGEALPSFSEVQLPEQRDGDLERYEGMLVRITSPTVVAQTYFLGRYGQLTLASPGDYGRPIKPTNIFRPGSSDAIALQEQNARSIFYLDDGQDNSGCGDNPNPVPYLGGPLPTPLTIVRGGDTVSELEGVFDQGRINSANCRNAPAAASIDYRLQPTKAPVFSNSNPRSESPADVGGSLKVASFNVLNYFTSLGQRGADNTSEFTRQRDKIIDAILDIDADILGLIEIENNSTALDDLVKGLNDRAGATRYQQIVTGAIGSDQIKVAFIYQPATVQPLGDYAVLDDSVDPRAITSKNRPALAQSFQHTAGNNGVLTLVVNHFKSKGSACDNPAAGSNEIVDPLDPDGQGNCNKTRESMARALVDWLASDPTSSGDSDVLILGDLNAYGKEDPIIAIEQGANAIDDSGTGDDYTNLIARYLGDDAYSFTFDGEVGYLDHALASSSLLDQVTGLTEWHINTDEAAVLNYDEDFNPAGYYRPHQFRSSDHDPVIIGLELTADNTIPAASIRVSPSSGLITSEAGDSASFTVSLSRQPSADVSISLTSSDSSEGMVSPSQLIFTASDYGAKTVTVTGVDDSDNDGDIAYSIVLEPAISNDTAFHGQNPNDVGITNRDNEQASTPAASSLRITAVVDGPLPGGLPKAVELYASEAISDLSSYTLSNFNNGNTSATNSFTLSGTVAAGEYLYLTAKDGVAFRDFFGFDATFTDTNTAINGDDALQLLHNGNPVDSFGVTGEDGTGTAWEYTDGWAYRNNGSAGSSTFTISAWSLSGVDALDGATSNATASTPVPLGSYTP